MAEVLTRETMEGYLPDDPSVVEMLDVWLGRGDGVAVYQNQDLGNPEVGHCIFASFGSPNALFETETPPERLPDFPTRINWRYGLVGTYRGGPLQP